MARTHGKIKIEVWESGSDYRALSVDAQWAYQMLLSQPGMTMCGVLLYAPKRWAKLARDLGLERLESAIGELESAWYVVVDRDSDELLVRTFIRHDEPWKLPNLVKAARRQFREIDSEVIRDYLADRHEWLVNAPQGAEKDWKETIGAYEAERTSERTSERTLPLPFERTSERPRARAGTRTPPAPTTTTAPTTAPEAEGPSVTGSTPRANGEARLPFQNERITIELLTQIGDTGDEKTADVVRAYAARLPEGALAKVLESVRTAKPNDRAAYIVGALKHEIAERQPPPPEPPRSQLLREDPEAFVRKFGPELEPDQLEHLLGSHVASQDERIRLADLAADLRISA